MENIRLNVPTLGIEESEEIEKVLESGYLTQGSKVVEFEDAIREHIDAKHVFATSSATTALHLSLVAIGIKPGDEVLVPDFTFPATANVVVQQGAIPVLVDIDSSTFAMNPEEIESKITPKTKAIMPIDPFGLPYDIDSVQKIAEKYGLPVIEDAACALGATYKDRPIGSFNTTTCFSFHPRKVITTGEGGILATNSDELAKQISILRTHGGIRGELYLSFVEAGFNYRLSDVLAAIGLAQTRKLSTIVKQRQELGSKYNEILKNVDMVTVPQVPSERSHTYQSYVVMLSDEIDRDEVIRQMKTNGVETTLGTYALHAQPYFENSLHVNASEFPVAERAFRQSLTLPLWPGMSHEQVSYVCETLEKIIKNL